jgi:electron transfer flavoprotein beta subunit
VTPGAVAVLVRRVPDPRRLSVDRKSGRLHVEGVPFILNPVDLQALELALRLRERHGWRVVVLSADHTGAEAELREALAMGADEAILLSAPEFEGTDPGSQAHIFQAALEKFVQPRLVLAAARSIDHTWSTIGPQLAYLLGWPLVIEAESLELPTDDRVQAVAHSGAHRARVEASLPAVVSVARGVIRPRFATAWGVADAFDPHRLTVKSLADLDLPPEAAAHFKSLTRVRRVTLAPRDRERRVIEGDLDDVARIVARRLIDKGWGGRRP